MAKTERLLPVTAARTPFGAYRGDVARLTLPAGMTISQIVDCVPGLDHELFHRVGVVQINGHTVDRKVWHRVRPRVDGPRQVSVTLHMPAAGGGRSGGNVAGGDGGGGGVGGAGGGSGKQILLIVAAIALIALTSWIGGGGIGVALGLSVLGPGTFGAQLLAAGIGIIGSLALSALSRPPALDQSSTSAERDARAYASVSSNLIGRGLTLPRVVGQHRIRPPMIAEPWVVLGGPDDEYALAAFSLAGPHSLCDVQINGVRVTALAEPAAVSPAEVDLEQEFWIIRREGRDDDTPIEYPFRNGWQIWQRSTDHERVQLLGHNWGDNAGGGAASPQDVWELDPDADQVLPVWHRFTSKRNPSTLEIHLDFPQGLTIDGLGAFGTSGAILPMRARMRPKGTTTWFNLPEMWWYGDSIKPQRFRIEIAIVGSSSGASSVTANRHDSGDIIPLYCWGATPGGADPATTAWDAHANWLDVDSGDVDYFGPSNYVVGPLANSNTIVRNVALQRTGFAFNLNVNNVGLTSPAALDNEDGVIWEVEIRRGAAFRASQVDLNYQFGGADWDFFEHQNSAGGSPSPPSQVQIRPANNLVDTIAAVRFVSKFNGSVYSDWGFIPPDPDPTGHAQLVVVARNRAINDVSVLAAGYALDYSASGMGEDELALDYQFLYGEDNGFTASEADLVAEDCGLDVAQTGDDPGLLSPSSLAIDGSTDYIVRIDIERIALRTAGAWHGRLQYATADSPGHAFSDSYYADIPEVPNVVGARRGLEIDMSDLAAGGSDWIDSTIDQLRFEFDAPGSPGDGEFRVRQIQIGTPGSAAGWTWLRTTSNPAPHVYDILTGDLNKKALAASVVDDDSLTEWRTHCDTEGYECNAIIDGRSIADALNLIAGCGYARPFKSELWGVAIDKDRTAEDPVQIFTPRNMREFRWDRAFPDLPDHLIVDYFDEQFEFRQQQRIVYRDGYDASTAVLPERTTYVGLITGAEVDARAAFDLRQPVERGTFYMGEVWTEHLVARRGDLVGIEHDVLRKMTGRGRVKSVTLDASSPQNVTALVLDSEVPIGLDDDGNADALVVCAALIRQKDGTLLTKQLAHVGGYTATLTFATPFEDPGTSLLDEDCLVAVGPLHTVYQRMILLEVTPGTDLTARLVLVDEGVGLWYRLGAGAAACTIEATASAGFVLAAQGAADVSIEAAATAEGPLDLAQGAASVAVTAAAAGTLIAAGAGAAAVAITATGAADLTAPPITFMGRRLRSTVNGNDLNMPLDQLQQGPMSPSVAETDDFVFVWVAWGGVDNDNITMTTSGYAQRIEAFQAGGLYDIDVGAFYKFMVSPADDEVIAAGPPDATDAAVAVAMVFRGVDQTTPFDVSDTGAAEAASAFITPAAITPMTSGAVIIVCAGGGNSQGSGNAYSDSASPTDYELLVSGSRDDTYDAMAGAGWLYWSGSGAFTPSEWQPPFADSSLYSARSVTFALRPA